MSANRQSALRAYGAVGAHSQIAGADGHRLVQLMYTNLLERLAAIKGYLQRSEVMAKCEQVDKVTQLLTELVDSLDLERGGEVAANLKRVYENCLVRLMQAHATNDEKGFEEVATHIRKLKAAWDTIGPAGRAAVGQ